MKYISIVLLVAVVMTSSCKRKKRPDTSNAGSSSGEVGVATSVVAKSIASVIQKFDGEEYVSTQLTGDPDYFIMYFTASW